MKIVTICAGGQVRSVAAKAVLTEQGHDVLAVGALNNSKQTVEMLCAWADKIIVMDDALLVAAAEPGKLSYLNVGPDRWGNPFHPELQSLVREKIHQVKP